MSVAMILFSFEGRIPRSKFWLGVACYVGMELLGGLIALLFSRMHPLLVALSCVIICVALIWAFLAIQVKRWHDRGSSGFMVLVMLIPVLGWLWSFVELGLMEGTVGANDYGNDPLEGTRSVMEQRARTPRPNGGG